MTNKHEKIEATLKFCDGTQEDVLVDKKVLPLINFLNSFHGVFSMLSCEGDSYNPWGCGPWVMFRCFNAMSLAAICEYVSSCFRIHENYMIIVKNILNMPAYRLQFESYEDMIKVLDELKNTNEGEKC